MAADLTQDSVLFFLQSRGGSAKNSDLLLHFRTFLQDPANRDRNRELFKKFVNSVAIVKQVDGASHVLLRRKFRGHVPGAGRDSPGIPAGNYTEPSAVNASAQPAESLAPPGETERKAALPAAGIVGKKRNNVEPKINPKLEQQQQVNIRNVSPEPATRQVQVGAQQQVNCSPDPVIRPIHLGGQQQVKVKTDPVIRPIHLGGQQQVKVNPDPVIKPVHLGGLAESSGSDQNTKLGQQGLVSGPCPGAPAVRLQDPDPPRGQEPRLQQVPVRRFRHRPSYKSAVSQDDDDDEEDEEVPVRPGSGGVWPLNPPLSDSGRTISASSPYTTKSPKPPSSSSATTQIYLQHMEEEEEEEEEEISAPRSLLEVQPKPKAGSVPIIQKPKQQNIRNISPDPVIRLVQVRGLAESFGPDQNTKLGQQGLVSGPCPAAPAVRLQDPDPPKGHEVPVRRFRHKPSYKSAVSQDDDDEEEVEEVPVRPGSGGVRSPCTTKSPEPSSSSSGRTVPQIYLQNMDEDEEEIPDPQSLLEVRTKLEAGSVPMETTPIRSSPPSESERHSGAPETSGLERPQNQPSGRSSVPRPSSEDQIYGGDWTPPSSSRTSDCRSSSEGLWTRAGEPSGLTASQEVLRRPGRMAPEPAPYRAVRWHRSTGNLCDEELTAGRLSPLYRSTDSLGAAPWHLSTGDLCDDREDAESSEGSGSSPQVQLRSAVVRRLSSRLRSRMCRSLGTDLDQIVQEEGGEDGGNEAAQLDRLHRISSSLSLPFNLSSSSLSSCTTPPRSHSPANRLEGEERRHGRKRLTCSVSSHAQSPVPLEPREHAWMVNGAVGAWTEIFSLFREDSSLLNKRDFISGFTVLHWIAKHGNHRALNTLWYGVEKFGLTFDINAKSTGGQTPLHLAAIHGHKKVIQLLVRKFDADVRLRDTAGKKPWQYLSVRSPDVLQLLGAPPRAALTERVGEAESDWQPKPQRRRLRHHFSSASSGQRPLTFTQMSKVKRSSSIAALLKHKSIPRFWTARADDLV
ncbi:uncharacterized protein LOC108245752 [Kryptolebias marmoratus]|uniref:uncharacterized protein LOC108245752 n=1 Tax=Kryptolebias marmoratus TaxID=37003 RepID=UPI0007F936E8|nr:uncharacterized protein LOC108245752 [Kryptolebias marmoratus]